MGNYSWRMDHEEAFEKVADESLVPGQLEDLPEPQDELFALMRGVDHLRRNLPEEARTPANHAALDKVEELILRDMGVNPISPREEQTE